MGYLFEKVGLCCLCEQRKDTGFLFARGGEGEGYVPMSRKGLESAEALELVMFT